MRLSRWSIEVVGLKSELERRYGALFRVVTRYDLSDISAIKLGHSAACGKCERLEEEFFADPTLRADSIALSLQSGWLGPADSETPKVVRDVRSEMLALYVEVKDRIWKMSDEDWAFARDVVDRVNALFDSLFSITGPDEFHWSEWIEALSDAGRVIKDQAFHKAGRGMSP